MAGKALLAVQYERQYAEAIDKDYKFTTTERTAYLTNTLRYSGQIVLDTTEDKLYRLNNARTAWVPVAAVSSTDDITTEGAVNKWWTNARTLASTLTGYAKSVSNTAIDATTTLLQYLQQMEYRVDVNTTNIAANTTSIAAKANIALGTTTGTTLTFAESRIYGSESVPETGNITYSATGAVIGVVNMMIHNSGTQPTVGGLAIGNDTGVFHKIGSSGDYVLGVKNYFYFDYISSTRINYSITQ